MSDELTHGVIGPLKVSTLEIHEKTQKGARSYDNHCASPGYHSAICNKAQFIYTVHNLPSS